MNILKFIHYTKKSFLTKIIAVLFLISSIGVILGSYFSTQITFRRLFEVEKKYNQRIFNDYSERIDQLVDQILVMFQQVYIEDFFGFSLGSLLNDNSSIKISEEERIARIFEKLQTINQNYPFTTDIALLDYIRDGFYFHSKEPGRAMVRDYSYSRDSELSQLNDSSIPVSILPTHYPEYLLFEGGGVNKYPVFSVCLNIFDLQRSLFQSPISSLIVNINPDIFLTMINDMDDSYSGRIIITTEHTGKVIFDSSKENSDIENVDFSIEDINERKFIFSEYTAETGYFKIYNIIDKDKVLKVYSYSRILMIRIMVITMLFLFSAAIIMSRLIKKRFRPLTNQMKQVRNGNLENSISITKQDEIGIIENAFNEMCTQLNNHIHEVYLQKLKYRTSQLRILQQQMNPHFMFNTLQSIHFNALMNKDEETAEMIHLLGDIFRWALDDSTTEVQLSEEILYLRTFVKLQAMRFEESIILDVNIPKRLQRSTIAKLSLQPLVENSIKHGLIESRGMKISINAVQSDDYLKIIISDNGKGMNLDVITKIHESIYEKSQKDSEVHIGLINVHSRLNMFYGNEKLQKQKIGITHISSSIDNGVQVELTIPIRYKNKPRN